MKSQHRFDTIAAVCLLAYVLSAGTSQASLVRIGFAGTIDFVDPDVPFADAIGIGAGFSGSYEYESSVADDFPDNPSLGGYYFPTSALFVQIDSLTFRTNDLGIAILNSNPPLYDNYNATNGSSFTALGVEWRHVGLTLRDATGTAFQNDHLPAGAPDLDDFEFGHIFQMIAEGHFNASLTGTLTSIAVIPEPGTLALTALALAYVTRRRRPGKRDT
ncbi:MAG: PEP-CTERM sorting domain-containing protein [Phycisphaerales bacterium]|nr:PEP-CTERM sorting domain-containing protein [Phycisphaerales bacterium]